MKNILLLFFLLNLVGCSSNKVIIADASNYKNNLEPGKCYYSLMENNFDNGILEPAFILEIEPNVYKEVERHYQLEQLNFEEDIDHIRLMTRKAHTKYIFKNSDIGEYTRQQNPIGYIYCVVEIPANYKVVYKKEVKQDGIVIKESQIRSASKIIKKTVRKKPKTLTSNQIYFEASYWTSLKEAIANGGCGGYLVSDIEKALVKFGYHVEVNNKMEEADKAALLDFQRKHQLEEGRLSFETLKKLGIIPK